MFFDAVEVQLSNSCGMPWTPEDVGEPVENLDEGVAIPNPGGPAPVKVRDVRKELLQPIRPYTERDRA